MIIAHDDECVLTITENGYGKRTKIEEYRLISRGGKGVRNIITSPRNGKVINIKIVKDEDELMVVSKKGILIRIPIKNISVIGRNTQGVRIIKMDEGDSVVSVAKIEGNGNHDHNHKEQVIPEPKVSEEVLEEETESEETEEVTENSEENPENIEPKK